MNNNGNFNNNPPTALMSYPFPMHNPVQHPTFMEQSYMNQAPQHFQPPPPRFYHQRPPMQAPKPEKRKQETLTCDACGIEVNSQQMMDAHIRGQKHIKKMKLKAVSTSNLSSNQVPVSGNVDQHFSAPSLSATNASADNVSGNECTPPAAAAATAAMSVAKPSSTNEKSALQMLNELAKHNKVEAKYDLVKEIGPAHSKQFEVQLTVGGEIYTGNGTSIKRAQQDAAEQALATTTLKKPESSQRGLHSGRGARGTGGPGSKLNIKQFIL